MSPARLIIRRGGHTYEVRPGAIDDRPDPAWVFRDPAGHEHRWVWQGGEGPLTAPASLPSCVSQRTSAPAEAGARITRYTCRLCGATVEPGLVERQVSRYLIDGVEVTQAAFEARATAAGISKLLID